MDLRTGYRLDGRRAAMVAVLIGTVAMALKGVWARLAYATGASVGGVLVVRFALATPVFCLLAILARSKPPAKTRARALVTGILFCVSAWADFTALVHMGAGPSRVVLFTYPVYVVFIEAARRRQWPHARDLLVLAVAWIGVVLVAGIGPDIAWRGAGWALVSAAVYSVYLVASQDLTRTMGTLSFTAWSNVGAAGAFAVLLALSGQAVVITPESVSWLLILVVFATVLPFILILEGIRRVGAVAASVLMLLGPPVTFVGAWWLLDERLTLAQLAGAGLTIAAVAWHARQRR